MMNCPNCGKIDTFCEDINISQGEVIGYHCTCCGYESYIEQTEEEEE